MQEEKVPSFLLTDDPIERLNKAMAFFRSTITSRYPQATIQEVKVDMGKSLDVSLVATESSETKSKKQDTSSRYGNDTVALDADIKPIYDEEKMAEVQLTTEWQHGQFFKAKSNEAKVQNAIDKIETINIELEHSVAKLLSENEHLHKDNEQLKKTYKDFYDSIKKTRVQTKDHNDSLIAQLNKKSIENTDLDTHIQEKVFAIAALKNELRKLKGNSRDTKFVDVNNDFSKTVTPYYWPNVRAPTFVKPHHVIASSESRNSSKNMSRFSSNDMVHNHYLEKAKKNTQERDKNSKTSVMPFARLQNISNGSKPKPRRTNQKTRNWPTHKSSYVMKTDMPKVLQRLLNPSLQRVHLM
ncbi:hypothetical protein Tco_0936552 [Tanacetum coccineum]